MNSMRSLLRVRMDLLTLMTTIIVPARSVLHRAFAYRLS